MMPVNLKPFESSPQFTFFHTYTWLAALLEAFPGWRDASRMIGLPDGRAVWLPLLQTDQIGPWRWLESMPLAFFGGPVVNEGQLTPDDFVYILSQIKKGAGVVNINLDPLNPLATPAHILAGRVPVTTHLLELPDSFEAAERRFNKTTRYHMRRAERAGVTVRRGSGLDDFQTYFDLMRRAVRRWGLDSHPFPRPIYQALARLPEERVSLWVADYQDRVVGGLISVHYRPDRVIYWSSALDPDYAQLTPTKLLQREEIRTACERGAKIYNMGPSVGFDGKSLDGVRQAKEALGAQPVDYAVAILMNPWAMRVRAVRNCLRRKH
jgi:hypothetical protein